MTKVLNTLRTFTDRQLIQELRLLEDEGARFSRHPETRDWFEAVRDERNARFERRH